MTWAGRDGVKRNPGDIWTDDGTLCFYPYGAIGPVRIGGPSACGKARGVWIDWWELKDGGRFCGGQVLTREQEDALIARISESQAKLPSVEFLVDRRRA